MQLKQILVFQHGMDAKLNHLLRKQFIKSLMLGLHDGIWLFLVFFTQSMILANLQCHNAIRVTRLGLKEWKLTLHLINVREINI